MWGCWIKDGRADSSTESSWRRGWEHSVFINCVSWWSCTVTVKGRLCIPNAKPLFTGLRQNNIIYITPDTLHIHSPSPLTLTSRDFSHASHTKTLPHFNRLLNSHSPVRGHCDSQITAWYISSHWFRGSLPSLKLWKGGQGVERQQPCDWRERGSLLQYNQSLHLKRQFCCLVSLKNNMYLPTTSWLHHSHI